MAVWKEIGLIGRSKILQKEILPIVLHPSKRFVLEHQAGAGGTAILQWCIKQSRNKAALVSAADKQTLLLDKIIEQWELEIDSEKAKPSLDEKETAILQCSGNTLFIDDLHKATASKFSFLKAVAERHKVCGAMRAGLAKKEDLKQFLWGVRNIKIKGLKNADTLKMSEKLVLHEASRLKASDVANASNGLPGRIVAMVNAGQIQRHDSRLRSEEIDIGPWLIGLFGFMAVFRILGRQMDATDLTLLGGAIMLIVRLFIYPFVSKGKQK